MDANNLNVKQQKALDEFKTKIKELLLDDVTDRYLLKWLTAKKFNVKQAEDMLKKHLDWRKRVGDAETLLDWDPPEVLKKYYAGGPAGYDKEGCPIWVDLACCIDFKGMIHSAKLSDILRYEARQMEVSRRMMKEQTEKLGKVIDQGTVVMDVSKLGMHHLSSTTMKSYSKLIEMTEDNYPGHMKAVYIINAPKAFSLAYKLVRPVLAEDTQKSLQILGGDWKEKLSEFIDPDQLPEAWGGTMADPDGDPHCKSQICMGGEIPRELYRSSSIEDREIKETVNVDKGKCVQLTYDITQINSRLSWFFKTATHDIKFGIFRKQKADEKDIRQYQTILPLETVNSHLVPQDGTIVCEEIGVYVVVFDNKESWVTKKSVSYTIEVIPR